MIAEVDVAARVLGGVGVFLSLASLVWQVVSWRLNGPRVRGEASVAVVVPMFEAVETASVKAINVRRAPIDVTGWGFDAPPSLTQFVWPNPIAGSTPLPHRLEPGASAQWFAPWNELLKMTEKYQSEVAKLIPFVHLGNGKRVTGKPRLRIPR